MLNSLILEFKSPGIDKMKKFLAKNQYEWTFLYHGNSESLKDKYEVRAIPLYYLIDPSGNFMRSPAKRPSENISELFDDLLGEGN